MRIYALSDAGRKLARSVRLPDKPAARVIYYLDKRDEASDEAIAMGTGLEYGETVATLRNLQAHRLVRQVGRNEDMALATQEM